jgi:hypothetical protein
MAEFKDSPFTEKPPTAKPLTENQPAISNKEYSKKDISNKELDIAAEPPAAKKEIKKTDNYHKQFIDFWHEIVQKTRGIKPIITAKDAQNLKRIISMDILSQSQMEQLAVYFLAHYSFKKFSPSIATFLSSGILNGLLDRAKNDENFWKELDELTTRYIKQKEITIPKEMVEKLNQLKQKLSMPFSHQERTEIQEEVAMQERLIK